MFGPIIPSFGPLDASIFILAEAPGDRESERGKPLVGPSGWALRQMLATVGLDLNTTYRCNVFSRQPPSNNLAHYCTEDPDAQFRELGPLISNPSLYMDCAHQWEIDRVREEIASVRPNLILALGNTATWALGLGTGINTLRGTIHPTSIAETPYKVLPTYHPSAVLRQWPLRTICISDLEKASHEHLIPHLTYDSAELWLNPTVDDLALFDRQHMAPSTICAADIETKRGQISHISFAPNPNISLAIPFWLEVEGPNYWRTSAEELEAWLWVRRWLERPDLTKVFQNGLFDLQYLTAPPYSFRPRACTEDTMLAHHSLFSELNKGLGFLGSVYTNHPSWKGLRTFKREEKLKRDD